MSPSASARHCGRGKTKQIGEAAKSKLSPEMQNANKGEQATRRLLINIGFAIEALLQDPRAFVVNSAQGHIDGFNLAGREGLHSFKIASQI